MIDRRLSPLFEPEHAAPEKARDLALAVIDPQVARPFISAWHSRLPNVQVGPWKIAYRSDLNGAAPAAAGKTRWEATP